jgi:hypothetical protein
MKFVCIKDGMEYWGAYDSDCNSDGTNNSRYFGYSVHTIDKFELMPEGFNPDKPTFEVGKWYKYSPWYLKLDYVNDSNVFVACETIDCNGRYENRDGEYFTCGEANHTKTLLTDLTEIQQYLPDGHVDKVKPIPEYVESNRSIYGMKKGKIYKVGTDGFILELPEHTYYTTEFVKSSTKEAYDAQFKTMEKNEFRKGDYIVCLKKPNSILDYIRPNFIFKQLKHSDGVYAEIDIKGSVTTCSDVSFKDTSTWRYATPEEMAEYDRLGKPYDVTTLVGKEQPMEDILEEAKRRYPVGTILKCLILNKDVKVTSHSTNLLNKVTQIYFQVEGNHTLVYSEGKWAEIVTPVVEPKAAKYIPKVGDWVITEGYSDNYDGKPLKINKINDGIFCFFDEVNFYENYSKSHNFHIDKAIRKAESHKIPKTGEPIQSFVVGKWYKNHPKINTYAKCLKPTSGGFKYEEAIFSGEYHKGAVSTWGKHSEMIEASLDEIQEFLPNFHSDKVFVSSKPHEYTPEEALAELKRRGFKKGVKYVYMYENGTYDEKDIRTANYEPCISGKQYIDCGGGYLWSKENPSHLHRGPVSKVNPCVEIFLPPSPQVSLWGELAPSTPNYLDPASLLKKVQLPI